MNEENPNRNAYQDTRFDVNLCECHARSPDTPEDPEHMELEPDDVVKELSEIAAASSKELPIRKIDPATGVVYEYKGKNVRAITASGEL